MFARPVSDTTDVPPGVDSMLRSIPLTPSPGSFSVMVGKVMVGMGSWVSGIVQAPTWGSLLGGKSKVTLLSGLSTFTDGGDM